MEYIIEDLFSCNNVHLIGGSSGSGKTTLVFQMHKAFLHGEDFLGRRTKPVKWGYISADRSVRSVQETQERLNTFFPIFSLVDRHMTGSSLTNQILPSLPSFYGYKPNFVYIDGFTLLPGNANDYQNVAKWLADLTCYCDSKNITILGACHTAKTREGEAFEDPRQRILGSVAWAAFTEGAIVIDKVPGEPAKRMVHLLPRNKPEEHNIAMMFGDDGYLKPVGKLAHQEEVADMILGPLIGTEPGPLDYKALLAKATRAGVSRRSFDRHLAKMVDDGKLTHTGRGDYEVPE